MKTNVVHVLRSMEIIIVTSYIKKSFLASLMFAISLPVFAISGTIGKHNLILLGDYFGGEGHIYGTSVIGGNVHGNLEVGSRLDRANTYDDQVDALVVLGDINASQVRVLQNHALVHGGELNAKVDSNTTVRQVAQTDIDYANSVFDEVRGDAVFLNSLQANGSFSNGEFSYDGNDRLAVFNVDASDIDIQNQDLKLWKGAADTVVINVSGDNVQFRGNRNSSDFNLENAPNIVWNFHEATNVDFNNYSPAGSIIAPYAHLTGGDFDGAVAAKSYGGNRQFHYYLFEGASALPSTGGSNQANNTPAVNAPSSYGLMAFLAIAFLMRKHGERKR